MADNLRGIPISSLPKADELVADDQLIAYREDNGKAYRANVGTLGEAAESNLSDAFSTSKTYSAGEYVIYNDTLWKFTADKDAGEWDESVVEKTTMGTEIGEINQSLSDLLIVTSYTTDSVTITGNLGQSGAVDFTVTPPTGYTNVGIVGFNSANNNITYSRAWLQSPTTVRASLINTTSSSITTAPVIYVLQMKS